MKKHNGHSTTIIKRSARRSHASHHSGAWKVAFADFTLAMMALFMVLWIMGASTEEERHEIVAMFYTDTLFDIFSSRETPAGSDTLPLFDPGGNPLPVAQATTAPALEPETPQAREARSQREIEELARLIAQITSAYNAQSNLHIEIVPQGLRILITDDQQREMFQRSSAILAPFFQRLLSEFAPALNTIEHKIMITGHTDATRYRDQQRYNNWNLSGDRALQARRVLTDAGLDEQRIVQVSGMADQMLFHPEDPHHAANRRIEIMVLTHSASEALYQFFGHHGKNVVRPIIDKISQVSE
ncbi:putative lateral flagellar export/assembly protein LafU [Mangrovibacter phragmitis]|uniref:putative lateral flagellar export/assembly protein LafU n=1 Tax=Mangrovibacter phragmitis TaxID=1691903 RepID=UPI00336A4870